MWSPRSTKRLSCALVEDCGGGRGYGRKALKEFRVEAGAENELLKAVAEANKVAQKTRLIPKVEVMEMSKRLLGLKLWSSNQRCWQG